MSLKLMWRLWSSEWKEMLARDHRKGLWLDTAAGGLHMHPRLNAVGAARLDAKGKERTRVAPRRIA